MIHAVLGYRHFLLSVQVDDAGQDIIFKPSPNTTVTRSIADLSKEIMTAEKLRGR